MSNYFRFHDDVVNDNNPWGVGEDVWDFGALDDDWADGDFDGNLTSLQSSATNSPPPENTHTHSTSRVSLPSLGSLDATANASTRATFARDLRSQPLLEDHQPLTRDQPRLFHTTTAAANSHSDRGLRSQHSGSTFGAAPPPPRFSPSEASDEFVELQDSSDDDDTPLARTMPASTRRGNSGRAAATVDLTSSDEASTSRPSRGTKRKTGPLSSGGEGRATKRRASVKDEDIEEIDLANDAPSAEEELRRQQQQDAIKSQQAAKEDARPQKLGTRQCTICLDKITNCTTTVCGHYYCHECLVSALNASERTSDRGVGTCPNCRKALPRNNKKTVNIVPIQFMKKGQFAKNQRKRTDIHGYR